MENHARWMLVFVVVALVGCSAPVWGGGADANEAPELTGVAWLMAGDQVAGLRLGATYGALEGYVEPRYDKDRAEDSDIVTDVRLYGVFNALDAAMASTLFGGVALPAGKLYGGVYLGFELSRGRHESGWLLGGGLELYADDTITLSICTEYQYPWQNFPDGGGGETFVVGPRIEFK